MINIEIKIKVAAAGGDYSKLQLQTWHQSTARQLPAKMIHIEYHRKSV